MKCTISAHEPPILAEAKAGDLFIVRKPALNECVCTRVIQNGAPVDQPGAAEFGLIVVACRVGEDEPGYRQTGALIYAHVETQITYVRQVEPLAFVERDEEEPASPLSETLEQIKALNNAFRVFCAEQRDAATIGHARSPGDRF